MKRSLIIAALFIAWLLFAVSIARSETVVLSFTGDDCPYCRSLERTWADAGVRAELVILRAERVTLNVGGMTDAQLAQWKINAIPVTVIGERLDDGSVRELRRLDGSATAGELQRFIRGGAR